MRAGQVFEGLAHEYQSLLQRIASERPDITSQDFDFTTTRSGTLQVVSSTLSANDKMWLQQQLNADTGLVSAANRFTSLVLQSYSTDFRIPNEYGETDRATNTFTHDLHTTYNYDGLPGTIYGSIKFVSLVSQLEEKTAADAKRGITSPAGDNYYFALAGNYVQQFLQANITQYVQQSDGTWAPKQSVGIERDFY